MQPRVAEWLSVVFEHRIIVLNIVLVLLWLYSEIVHGFHECTMNITCPVCRGVEIDGRIASFQNSMEVRTATFTQQVRIVRWRTNTYCASGSGKCIAEVMRLDMLVDGAPRCN